MRASQEEYLKARNATKPPRFSTWAREYLAKSTSEMEYYEFAKDLITYVPIRIEDRKAFDRDAVKFIVEYPQMAFRYIQENQVELSTPDLVTMVKKNIFMFIPLLTKEQKLQYKQAGERLLRISVSLNREKLTKKSFILVSQLHNLEKLSSSADGGVEPPLYQDHMYAKFMREVLSDYYDIDHVESNKELWPHWLKFLSEQPIE